MPITKKYWEIFVFITFFKNHETLETEHVFSMLTFLVILSGFGVKP